MKSVLAILALAVAVPAGAQASPSPIDGSWQLEFSCKGATGMYADRCAEGDRDNFTLDLLAS